MTSSFFGHPWPALRVPRRRWKATLTIRPILLDTKHVGE